jgi:hypothetical protein
MRSIEQGFDRPRHRGPGAMVEVDRMQDVSMRLGGGRPTPRLTRRGRLVVTLVALVLLVVGFSAGRVASQAAGPARPLPTVTVHAGETLWQIAARIAPHADPRPVVLELEQLNHLPGPRVVAGQQLLTPRG